MAWHKHPFPPETYKFEIPTGRHECGYYLCDTESDKSVITGYQVGDLLFTIDSGNLYCALTTASWSQMNSGGGAASSVIYAPTGGAYLTFSANTVLTSEKVLTAGSSVTLVTDATAVYINALTNAAVGGPVYAPTGGNYLVFAADATLTNEKALTAGSSVTLVTDATAIYVTAQTPDVSAFVSNTRTITTLYPLAGGSSLNADRTFSADTAFLVTSARTITAGVGLTGGGNLSANITLNFHTGGAGQYVITSHGATEGLAWITTAAAGGGPVYAPTGGFYLAWSADTLLSNEKILTAGSSVTIVTDATAVYINALTGGGGSGLSYAPMEWSFVAGNAVVWTNMPAASTELFGNTGCRTYVDLVQATSARLLAAMVVAGTAPAYLQLQASTDNGATWQPLVAATTHLAVGVGVASVQTSPWVLFNSALRREVLVRMIGSAGNGAIDPSWGILSVQVK